MFCKTQEAGNDIYYLFELLQLYTARVISLDHCFLFAFLWKILLLSFPSLLEVTRKKKSVKNIMLEAIDCLRQFKLDRFIYFLLFEFCSVFICIAILYFFSISKHIKDVDESNICNANELYAMYDCFFHREKLLFVFQSISQLKNYLFVRMNYHLTIKERAHENTVQYDIHGHVINFKSTISFGRTKNHFWKQTPIWQLIIELHRKIEHQINQPRSK